MSPTLLLAGLQPDQIARLRIDDISPSGCRVTVPHLEETHIRQLPRHAGGLIRAQLLDRRSSDARPHERLLVRGHYQPCFGYEIERLANRGARHAHLWRPADEFAPLWHQSPSTTLTVDVEPLGGLRR